MSVRETSRDAYHAIKENGLLSRRRFEVYEYLYLKGPSTAREMYNSLCAGGKINPSSYLSRLSELRDMGVVRELPDRKLDPETGQTVLVWEVIKEKLPVKFDRPVKKVCPTCKGSGLLIEQQACFDLGAK